MKKDVYPDVRIEIISEGLTKKILGKTKDATPVVYGEEKPTGENLPNIDSKGKNKEMGGLLQVSNKKPTYTSIIKEAIIELRKQPDYGGFQPGGRTTGGKRSKRISDMQARNVARRDAALEAGPTDVARAKARSADLERTGGQDITDASSATIGRRGSGFEATPFSPPTPVSEMGEDKEPASFMSQYTGQRDRTGSSTSTKGKAPTGGTDRGAGGLGEANPRDFSDSGSSSTSAETSGSTGGKTTRKLSARPEVFQSDRPDFDMARGPGARVGDKKTRTQTLMTPGSGSLGEKAIVKEVVAEFLNKGKVWDVRKETWVTKQAPPMTTSATKPPNMGVGMQQPVVSGAGSMKNIDKAKMNKEPAPAAKRKTAPRPRKNIQAAIIKAATLAVEKAKGRQGRAIPKSRQFKQSDLGRGATTFTETTEKRSRGRNLPSKARSFRQKPKRATGGMAETYRG